jgi:hypothetical protein
LAEGWSASCRDDFDAARRAFEDGIALAAPAYEPSRVTAAWCLCMAGYLEALIGLGKLAEAKSAGDTAIAICEKLEIDVASHGISRALALAEAQLGYVEQAVSRVDAVTRRQSELGVTGLQLGASYETRARMAIASKDQEAFDHYAELTGRTYGSGSALAARFERLMHDGLVLARGVQPAQTDFPSTTSVGTEIATATVLAQASETLKNAGNAEEQPTSNAELVKARG